MTNQADSGPRAGSGSLTETATDVSEHAAQQARQVAGEAGQQAQQVVTEVKEHAVDLVDQTRAQARQKAEESTRHVASGLRSLSGQIEALRDGRTEDAGPVANYAEDARRRIETIADRLERGGLDGVARDLAGFARRRPGLFLVSCAGAGFALARLVRAGAGGDASDGRRSTPSPSPMAGRGPTRAAPTGITPDAAAELPWSATAVGTGRS